MTERTVKMLLAQSFTGNIGLLRGRTGLAIVFFYWARLSGDERYAAFAGQLLDEVLEEIRPNMSLGFRDGLCGIGWGLYYLIRNGFIEGDADDILEELDAIVASFDPNDCTDDSFETGNAGVEFYIASRRGDIPVILPAETVFRWGEIETTLETMSRTDGNHVTAE